MSVRINPSVRLSGTYPDYPLVLRYESGDLESPNPYLTFSILYRLAIDGDQSQKTVHGIVDKFGMSSRNCLDDEDADELYLSAERESVEEVTKYLRELFSGAKLTGFIHTLSADRKTTQRKYDIPKDRYVVHAVEEVIDAFDDFEHYNQLAPIQVEADSTEEAVRIGYGLHQKRIDKDRREGGFIGSGSFYVIVTKVLRDGQVVFEKGPPERAL